VKVIGRQKPPEYDALNVFLWLLGGFIRLLGFNSQSGRYRVVSIWIGDYVHAGRPSLYITNTNLSAHGVLISVLVVLHYRTTLCC